MTVTHSSVITVKRDGDGGKKYYSTCECGWASRRVSKDMLGARKLNTEHREETK